VVNKNNNIEEWVKAAMAGEEHAWSVLYQRYYPGLYAAAIQLCGHLPEAKDIVQDSFVTAWLKISQLKEAITFGSWIKTILIRKCYQWRHKSKRKMGIDPGSSPDEHLIGYELERELDHLYLQDCPKYCEALYCFDIFRLFNLTMKFRKFCLSQLVLCAAV
jgi:DNA-directed RNA polymerase specialized sigma24 family protein